MQLKHLVKLFTYYGFNIQTAFVYVFRENEGVMDSVEDAEQIAANSRFNQELMFYLITGRDSDDGRLLEVSKLEEYKVYFLNITSNRGSHFITIITQKRYAYIFNLSNDERKVFTQRLDLFLASSLIDKIWVGNVKSLIHLTGLDQLITYKTMDEVEIEGTIYSFDLIDFNLIQERINYLSKRSRKLRLPLHKDVVKINEYFGQH